MPRLLPALLVALGIPLTTLPAPAEAQQQPRCAPRPQVLVLLTEQMSETRRAIGLTASRTVMELYASEAGSWTLVVTLPSGLSCLVATGDGFETLAEGAGAPA